MFTCCWATRNKQVFSSRVWFAFELFFFLYCLRFESSLAFTFFCRVFVQLFPNFCCARLPCFFFFYLLLFAKMKEEIEGKFCFIITHSSMVSFPRRSHVLFDLIIGFTHFIIASFVHKLVSFLVSFFVRNVCFCFLLKFLQFIWDFAFSLVYFCLLSYNTFAFTSGFMSLGLSLKFAPRNEMLLLLVPANPISRLETEKNID